MAYLDVARGKASYTSAVIFRGEFDSGAAVAWATADVMTSTGLVQGRMELSSEIESGMPEAVGGTPERPSCTIVLNNHDDALAAYIRGTSSSVATSEYGSDSFLNLTGKLYHYVRDDDGNAFEEAVSPTLCASGTPTYNGHAITVHLAAQDDNILGHSPYQITVRQIVQSASTANDGSRVDRAGTASTYTQGTFDDDVTYWKENLDQKVPFLYGKTEIPLIQVADQDADTRGKYVCFVTKIEPSIASFDEWELYSGKYGAPFFLGDSRASKREAMRAYQAIHKIERTITLADDSTVTLWVVWFTTQSIKTEAGLERRDEKHYMIPSINWIGIATGDVPPPNTSGGPIGVIKAIIRDHAANGSAPNTTAFNRAAKQLKGGNYCGGLYYGDAKISEVVSHILEAFAISCWIENDDSLRVLVAWGQEDKDEIDAGTPYHIAHAEIVDGWQESIPLEPNARGAPVSRVTLEWSRDREDFYGDELIPRVPGATDLPLAAVLEESVSGAWVFPPAARTALGEQATRRSFVARRVKFVGRAWLATIEKGTIFFVSHPRGLGDNSGGGYDMRPMRLERVRQHLVNDACEVELVDLEADYLTKPATLDTIDYWIEYDSTGTGVSIDFTSASPTVTLSSAVALEAWVDCNLWAIGAATAGNRISRRITGFNSTTSIEIEQAAAATETVGASTAGTDPIDTNWIVVKTRLSEGAAYRDDKITLCDEATGLHRDGSTAGYQVV